jgi:iron complex transport system substrate-binding protein
VRGLIDPFTLFARIVLVLAGLAAGPISAGTASPPSTPQSAAASPMPGTAPAAAARRVVTLSPHLTELVYAAGGGDRIVGVMRYSDYPDAARALPIVGDAFAINLEAIARLKPDLVLAWRSGTNERQRDRLRSLGVNVVDNEIERVADIAASLRQIGRLLGTEAVADAQAARVEQGWQALRDAHAKDAPVRVFYQLWADPLMTVSRQHLVNEAITACGGVNVFEGAAGLTPTVGWEAVARANPQLVVTSASTDEPAQLGAWQRLPQVDAVRHGRLVTLDGHLLARMTPRFVTAAQSLCAAIDQARRSR